MGLIPWGRVKLPLNSANKESSCALAGKEKSRSVLAVVPLPVLAVEKGACAERGKTHLCLCKETFQCCVPVLKSRGLWCQQKHWNTWEMVPLEVYCVPASYLRVWGLGEPGIWHPSPGLHVLPILTGQLPYSLEFCSVPVFPLPASWVLISSQCSWLILSTMVSVLACAWP